MSTTNLTADALIELLELSPLPAEGGFFRETYRSMQRIPQHALSGIYTSSKSYSTAIYYLLTPDSYSSLHRLPGDEIFHFYLGDPVEMLQLFGSGFGKVVTIGSDIIGGMLPQVIVPAGTWQGSRLKEGGSFALLGTTMSPGFDFEDFTAADKASILTAYPAFKSQIERYLP